MRQEPTNASPPLSGAPPGNEKQLTPRLPLSPAAPRDKKNHRRGKAPWLWSTHPRRFCPSGTQGPVRSGRMARKADPFCPCGTQGRFYRPCGTQGQNVLAPRASGPKRFCLCGARPVCSGRVARKARSVLSLWHSRPKRISPASLKGQNALALRHSRPKRCGPVALAAKTLWPCGTQGRIDRACGTLGQNLRGLECHTTSISCP
jgi:hypothetical protein